MQTVGNVIWLLLAGIWLAIAYVIAGILNFITIIGIPFSIQSFKLANYALWPFGRVVVERPGSDDTVSLIGNVLWFLLGGWFLVLLHFVAGVILILTIIGIPLGIASIRMAALALAPFGKEIVPASTIDDESASTVVASVPALTTGEAS